MANLDFKFKVGGQPPPSALTGSKYAALYAALDDIEIGVWARTEVPDEKAAKNALQAARKYLKPRNISIVSALEKKGHIVTLWIKRVDDGNSLPTTFAG